MGQGGGVAGREDSHQPGRQQQQQQDPSQPSPPPGTGAFVPGWYWRGCAGYRPGFWTSLGLDSWDLGRERSRGDERRDDGRTSGKIRVSPVSHSHAHRLPCACPVCVRVCCCRRIPASHVRSVVSRPRFELHLIWLWVGGMRLCRQAVFRVGSSIPFRLRNMGMGVWAGIGIRARQASLIRASCHAMSTL